MNFINRLRTFIWRKPDLIVYNPEEFIYLRRWWIIPRNRFGFNIYLHHFLSSDEDRALHSHPWKWNISILLSGSYLEHVPVNTDDWILHKNRDKVIKKRYPLVPIYRNKQSIHKIELINNKPIWTIFITGPVIQEWGFYCPSFWRSHEEFLDKSDKTASIRGRGCD